MKRRDKEEEEEEEEEVTYWATPHLVQGETKIFLTEVFRQFPLLLFQTWVRHNLDLVKWKCYRVGNLAFVYGTDERSWDEFGLNLVLHV